MRILYVTNGFPYPLTSGYLRHYFLIRELARWHGVTLLSIGGADFVPEHAQALVSVTDRVLTFESANGSRSLGRKAKARLRRLLGGVRADSPARRLGEAAAALARDEDFDVVLFSGKRTYPALAFLHGLPLVVDMCDATSARIRGSFRVAPPARLPLLALDYLEVRRVERGLAARADHLVFVSCRDRDTLLPDLVRGRAEPRATVVPNGVDLDYWRRASQELGRDHVVFTGAMDYPPNEDAALRLIETIMPLVRRSVPAAHLLVVGRDPTRRLVKAGTARGVTVTGFVDDVRPYLERAAVFAAPLRFGAGIQNKVLEAMAMEVPTVASSLAADGLRTDDGRTPPIAVADDPRPFAELVVERLLVAAEGSTPDEEARRFVSECFSWSAAGELLEEALRSVAAEARRPAGVVKA